MKKEVVNSLENWKKVNEELLHECKTVDQIQKYRNRLIKTDIMQFEDTAEAVEYYNNLIDRIDKKTRILMDKYHYFRINPFPFFKKKWFNLVDKLTAKRQAKEVMKRIMEGTTPGF